MYTCKVQVHHTFLRYAGSAQWIAAMPTPATKFEGFPEHHLKISNAIMPVAHVVLNHDAQKDGSEQGWVYTQNHSR